MATSAFTCDAQGCYGSVNGRDSAQVQSLSIPGQQAQVHSQLAYRRRYRASPARRIPMTRSSTDSSSDSSCQPSSTSAALTQVFAANDDDEDDDSSDESSSDFFPVALYRRTQPRKALPPRSTPTTSPPPITAGDQIRPFRSLSDSISNPMLARSASDIGLSRKSMDTGYSPMAAGFARLSRKDEPNVSAHRGFDQRPASCARSPAPLAAKLFDGPA